MAKPDTDDGWLKYAHELDAALAVADFTKAGRIVLREVFSQIFGPAKRRTAEVSATKIGAAWGMDRQNVHRGVKELQEANVLRKQDDGRFAFNKDYESWLASGRGSSPGQLRLSPNEVKACCEAPSRAMAFKGAKGTKNGVDPVISPDDKPSSNEITPCHLTGLQNGEGRNLTGLQVVISPDDSLSSKLPTENAAPQTPIEDRARDLRQGDKETAAAARESDDKEPQFITDPEFVRIQDGPHDHPEAEIRRLFSAAWRQWRNAKLCYGLVRLQRKHSIAAWRAALNVCVEENRKPRSAEYVDSIAADFNDDGTPKRGRKSKPRDSPASNPNLFRFEVATPAAEESPFTRAHRERAEKLATEQAAQRQKGN